MTMLLDAQKLYSKYPLPRQWSTPELFSEVVRIRDFVINLVGFHSRHSSGRLVTGSAGDPILSPVDRAYFELLERATVVDAIDKDTFSYNAFDSRRIHVRTMSAEQVFRAPSTSVDQSLSNSNGVAVDITWRTAC